MGSPIPLALLGRVEAALEKEAVDNLTTQFMEGEKVGKYDIFDLLESELYGMPTGDFRFLEIVGILKADPLERSALIYTLYQGLIERHLNSNIDLIHDEMDRLEEPNV